MSLKAELTDVCRHCNLPLLQSWLVVQATSNINNYSQVSGIQEVHYTDSRKLRNPGYDHGFLDKKCVEKQSLNVVNIINRSLQLIRSVLPIYRNY